MACYNACPVGAVYIDCDSYGYEKIEIDSEKCIKCGKCEKVCGERNNIPRNTASLCYAAQATDRERLAKSASGGAFQMLAEAVLEKGGVCYGCTANISESGYSAEHIKIAEKSELPEILNSKYVPSFINNSYADALEEVKTGRLVLFSGTPCQIQGLRAFLGKDYDNLITADLICHGVTATRLFNDYIKTVEETDKIKITQYLFRDKSVSWGTNFCYSYKKEGQDKIYTRHCPREESSYMAHYLRGNIFRENCYSCSISSTERVSDFTLGDYWEIENEHPEFVTKNKPAISLRRGVSCILVNTEKGKKYASLLKDKMLLHEVTLQSIASHNGNLRAPSKKGAGRESTLELYKKSGYGAVDKKYRAAVGNRKYKYRIKNALKSHLPDRIRILCYQNRFLSKIVFR